MSTFWREFAESAAPERAGVLADQGVSRGVRNGSKWCRTSRGFYVPAAAVATQVTATQRTVQAWPQLPPGATIGGWAAAYALGVTALDGLDPNTLAELPVTAILPPRLHRSSRPDLRYVRERLPASQTYEMEGIRWTRELRTALDLARWAPDLVEAVVALDAMLAARVVRKQRIEQAVLSLTGQRGAWQVRRAVCLSRTRTKSTWETRLRMLYVLELGFATPLVNQPVFDSNGVFLGAPELLDPDAGLAMEFDGADHRDKEQHRRDNVREELLERTGLIVVRTDNADMRKHRPTGVAVRRACGSTAAMGTTLDTVGNQPRGATTLTARRRAALAAVGRFAVTFAIVLTVYYLLPLRADQAIAGVVLWLLLALLALVAVVAWQVRQIGRARHPVLRAGEALGIALPLFLCSFAATYVLVTVNDPGAFSEPLSHTAALYFTIVVFGTVGFGDIAPVSDAARLLVASQVLLDLVFIAVIVRTLFAASRRTISKRGERAAN